MRKKEYDYECPHCKAVGSLLIAGWSIDLSTGRTDRSNGYICTKCKNKVAVVEKRSRKFIKFHPDARRVAI